MLIGRIISTPTENQWAQVFSLKLEPHQSRLNPAWLILVVELVAPESYDLPSIGKGIFEEIHQTLVEADLNLFEQTTQAIRKGKELAEGHFPLTLAGETISFAAILAVVHRQYAYLGQFGGASGCLWRQGQLHVLLTGETEDKTLSGLVESGDILVLASPAFVQVISRGEITAALANGDSLEAADALTLKIHAGEIHRPAAAAFGQIESRDFPEETLPPLVTASASNPTQTLRSWSDGLFKAFNRVRNLYQSRLPKKPEQPEVYVQSQPQKVSSAKLRLVMVFLTSILVLSIWQALVGRNSAKRGVEINQLLSQADQKYHEALMVEELDRSRSQELVLQAQKLLDQARNRTLGFPFSQLTPRVGSVRLDTLQSQIAGLEIRVSQSFEVTPEIIFDLTKIASGSQASSLSLTEKELLVLDSSRGALYQIDPQTKDGKEAVVDERLKKAIDLDQTSVLTGQEVMQLDSKQRLVTAVTSLNRWQGPTRVVVFGSNLYLLDPGANQIFKYVGLAEGYSSAQDYLQEKDLEIKTAQDMAIDGRVFLIDNRGEIAVLMGGRLDVFIITGLDQPFSSNNRIYTDNSLENVYVLDRNNQRLVILNKSGEYKKQLKSPDFSEAADFVVSEATKQAFFVKGNQIKVVGLK